MTRSHAIWSIALPAMATNVATALFGIADTWVIGRLGDAAAQGGVELGARLLMALLFAFNFLRTGTIGLTAQAAGRDDVQEQLATLLRALAVALAIGAAILLARSLVVPAFLDVLEAEGMVRAHARTYVGIRYWASPVWLVNAALTGWLIGRRRVRAVLWVEVVANLVHVGLDLLLVLGLGLGVAGVAFATVASEAGKLLLLAAIVLRDEPARALMRRMPANLWHGPALGALFRVNRDLFLRTVLLTLSFVILTRQGAQQGAVVLAANAILFQLFSASALLLDGFENAAQVLCGERAGARDAGGFNAVTRAILVRGFAVAALLAAVFAVFGPAIVSTFSTDPAVVASAVAHAGWLIAIPLAGVASFIFDGVFIGATWTRAMLLTMAAAFAVFIAALWLAAPLGNHGLWLAFTSFLAVRAVGQALAIPRLASRTFAPIVAVST